MRKLQTSCHRKKATTCCHFFNSNSCQSLLNHFNKTAAAAARKESLQNDTSSIQDKQKCLAENSTVMFFPLQLHTSDERTNERT